MQLKTLNTIGYEGSSIDDFIATLEVARIELLIDVRDVPISRKRGFSKSKLTDRLFSQQIGYLHLKGLGDPKQGRIAAREGRIDDFRRIFSAHMETSVAQKDLAFGVSVASNKTACLMCFEREHRFCHRCMVAEEMAKQGGFRLVHLGVRDGLATTRTMTDSQRHEPTSTQMGYY